LHATYCDIVPIVRSVDMAHFPALLVTSCPFRGSDAEMCVCLVGEKKVL
jgi:hypothetical protein